MREKGNWCTCADLFPFLLEVSKCLSKLGEKVIDTSLQWIMIRNRKLTGKTKGVTARGKSTDNDRS